MSLCGQVTPRARRRAALAVGLLLALGQAVPAVAAGRVALVIGNSQYAHAVALPNPANDATDVGGALGRLGFDVTTVRDAGRTALAAALADFTDRSAGAEVALVFYAGHGMEMDGVNYLLPVDARIERDTHVRFETVTLDDVLAATAGAALRLVILDACRNNPLARSMQRSVRTRSASGGSLAALDEAVLGDETLVAYSAAAGTTAADGEGRNSPYAAALLEHLEQPVEILTLFRRVRGQVLGATGGRQRPHEYQSLLREHYLSERTAGLASAPSPAAVEATLGLNGAARRAIQQRLMAAGFAAGLPDGVFGPQTRTAIQGWQQARGVAATGYLDAPSLAVLLAGSGGDPPPAVDAAAEAAQRETMFWDSIRESTNPADFLEYRRRFPGGVFEGLAENRLAVLRADAPDRPAPRPAAYEARPGAAADAPGGRPDVNPASVATLAEMLGREVSAAGRDENGWTDLHYAALFNLPDVVAALVERGADVDARLLRDDARISDRLRRTLAARGYDFAAWSRNGETPLHVAAWVDAGRAVERLVAWGANANARTPYGWTPLHYAASANARRAFEELVAGGADAGARDVNGDTPADVLRRR